MLYTCLYVHLIIAFIAVKTKLLIIAAIPLIKMFGVGKSGVRKLVSLMSCFRGDLPELSGIVGQYL